jgi:aryl-alcohol dehydrogenase-like predicted oxidoreductase
MVPVNSSHFTRRELLAGVAAVSMVSLARRAAAHAAGPRAPAAAAGALKIGGDLVVNRMGFGAMRLTGPGIWGEPRDAAEARRVLRRAIELGVNFIDTADAYGPEVSERLIKEALHPYPSGLVIATKGGTVRPEASQWAQDGSPAHLREACEASLRRLKLERIDLYQLHRIDAKVPVADSLGELARLQQQGKIRHIGLSQVSVDELATARRIVPVVSVQNRYNVADRASADVLAVCERERLAFIPWAPIARGSADSLEGGTGQPIEAVARAHEVSVLQAALAWLLAKSPVMLPIPGTSSVAHLEEDIAAAHIRLTAAELAALG